MLEKHLQAKKKHHYVWANYLLRWSCNGKDVHYTTGKNNNIVCESVRGLAMEKHFYKVQPLTSDHLTVINGLSSHSPEWLQEEHQMLLNGFLKVQKFEMFIKKQGVNNPEANQTIEAMKSNMLENFHSSHENEVQDILKSLAERDLSILSKSNNMVSFMAFLGQQTSRTKNFKDKFVETQVGRNNDELRRVGKIMEESWWFISYLFGTNIGASNYLGRNEETHCLLINDTDIPFITSDQPIVNVHEGLQENTVSPPDEEHCDFYYPISPNVAYMICRSNRFPKGKVNILPEVAIELNTKMAKVANVNIIGNSVESIRPFQRYIGSKLDIVKNNIFEPNLYISP